jgi:aspartate racemase
MKEKKFGILGGMGPEATIYFFQKITKATEVKKDQDHLRIIIDSNPQVPDRTAYILGEGPSPLPALLESLALLEKCGVDLIAIPCNTAHYFIDDLRKNAQTEILSMIELTRDYIESTYPSVRRIALLATCGTVESKIYQKIFRNKKYVIFTPEKEEQDELMETIYKKIKRGEIDQAEPFLEYLCKKMIERGAEAIITGCTEIPLATHTINITVPLIDPMEVTVQQIISRMKSQKVAR